MKGRRILLAAGLLYAAVLFCSLLPGRPRSSAAVSTGQESAEPAVSATESSTLPAPRLVDVKSIRPFCAIALQLQRVDWVERYEKTIDDIAAAGADSVSLIVDTRQENSYSTYIYIDVRKTMSDSQLTEIIAHAKSKHLRVILMPIVLLDDPDDPSWRGTIHPVWREHQVPTEPFAEPHSGSSAEAWARWFHNYRDMICHYAYISQATGVDLLVVGSELVSSEEHLDEWITTILAVRDIYKGPLTYSSNWDRYSKVPFWKYLDFVGMNSYWRLGVNSSVTTDTIEGNWRSIQEGMFKFLDKVHKPVILLEAGWCSLANAAVDSWDYTQDTLPADNDLQRRLYKAFFQSWWGQDRLAGFVIWGYSPDGDPTGKGYSPQGKPAEDVLRDWMAKPRWTVQPQ